MDKIILSALGAVLLILISIAGYLGAMTIQESNALARVESELESHSKYFEKVDPVISAAAVAVRRMDDEDKRGDRMETHLEATDRRVDVLESHERGRSYPH